MQQARSPYVAHIWVCVHTKSDGSKACGNGLGMRLKDLLKEGAEARGWKGKVRVSYSGCMGLCARGPNVIIHPTGLWFSQVTEADVPSILDAVGALLASRSQS